MTTSFPTHRLAPLAAALATALAMAGAEAAPDYSGDYGLNPDPQQESVMFFAGPGFSVDNAYFFQLDRPHHALAAAVSLESGPEFSLVNSMVTLWHDADGDPFRHDGDILLGGFDFFGTTVSQRFADLQAGSYYWRLEATTAGLHGGSLLFSSSVSAVPEPASLALMLAGLGGIGGLVRRRLAEA